MKITQRLEGRARTAARAARDLGRSPANGPQAVYARVLDGERLWLAVEADAGVPALRRAGGEIVDPDSDLPSDHGAHEPGVRSVRWLLTTLLPEEHGAELEVVVRPRDGSDPLPVLGPEPHPESPSRADTTPDGRWRFVVDAEPGLVVRVRRTATPPASRLLSVSAGHGSVTITCERAGRDHADLILVDSDRQAVARLATEATEHGFSCTLTSAHLPGPGGYRVALGDPDDFVPVTRWHADVRLDDQTTALLPMLTDEDGDRVVARLRFSARGNLRLHHADLDARDDA
ncbi:hypothetical protein ABLE68_12330 [Nocardioides sp. CN2-186]|uniref:hypothetical protein n=1 Tax=Nocardioides tweenelious TaxID=3156607 RepID=UPI0032B45E59